MIFALAIAMASSHGVPAVKTAPMHRQETNYTCGVACLRFLLAHNGVERDEASLARRCKSHPIRGTDPAPMARVAREEGFKVSAHARMSLPDLRRHTAAGRPVMVLIQDNGGHYVVVVGASRKTIKIADPSGGRFKSVPAKEFMASWYDFWPDGRLYPRWGMVIRRKK